MRGEDEQKNSNSYIPIMYLWCLLQILCGNPELVREQQWCGRPSANTCLSKVTAHTLLSNISMVLGIPSKHMTKDRVSHRIGRALMIWCSAGFPNWLGGDSFRILHQIHGLLLEWLFNDKLVAYSGC